MLMDSARWIEPAPTLELSEPILTTLVGSKAGVTTFSKPKKLVRLAFSELVRLREVVFCILAVSATETFTVITSPTCMARGSWKKLCEPGCHRELLSWVIGWGRGIPAPLFCPWGFRQQQGGKFQDDSAHGKSLSTGKLVGRTDGAGGAHGAGRGHDPGDHAVRCG